MDKNIIGGLINSISRLIHLVACQTMKSSDLKGITYIVRVLKLLKPVLDEVLETGIPSDEKLTRELEELDIAVNKSREFMEKRSYKMSKIYTVSANSQCFCLKNVTCLILFLVLLNFHTVLVIN